jgi:hypothetical protein
MLFVKTNFKKILKSFFSFFGTQIVTRRNTCIFDLSLRLKFSHNQKLINHLGQVAWDISCKWKKVFDERKNKKIKTHALTPLYTYCHMRLQCNYFGYNWGKWCVAMCFNIELF